MTTHSSENTATLDIIDEEPTRAQFRRELLAGLRASPKTTPCKYLYDERGSALFDEICEQPEYYPTRTEIDIMRRNGREIADAIGEDALVIELGSGSSVKTRLLLDHLRNPAGYVPLDISREHLEHAATSLAQAYPHIEVLPLCADYTRDIDPPTPRKPVARRVAYFPGSTIGNFHRADAAAFLKRLKRLVRGGKGRGALLIGVDLKKPVAELEAAYNDAASVTASFNFNLLRRINRELEGDLDRANFAFKAIWNENEGRIESNLISKVRQTVHVAGEPIELEAGEHIRTECSYKYTVEEFTRFAADAGWLKADHWTDERQRFAVMLLESR